MIRVHIGAAERVFENADDVDEHWIHSELNGRQSDRERVCVRVHIEHERICLGLHAGTCPSFGGGGRAPHPEEQEIFQLWNDRVVRFGALNSGHLTDFFKRLSRILR
jgi:hypothetical protein